LEVEELTGLLKQAVTRVITVVIVVTLMFAITLVGTQCAVEEPPEPPAKDALVVAAKDSPADAKAQADYIGDGVADDVEIQAAVDTMGAAGGGKVILLEGTYQLSDAVYMASHTTLEGQGYDTLLIQQSANRCITVQGETDVTIRNLRADANGKGGYAIDVRELAKRVIIENVWAFNALDDEITVVHGAEDVIIRNSTVRGDYGGGSKANIETGDEAKRVTISNNTLLGGHEDRMGIAVNRHPGQYDWGEDIVITGNIINGVKADGINAGGNRITISGNSLSNIGGYGVKMTGGTDHNITDNIINGVKADVINVEAQGMTISGNIMNDVKGDGIRAGGNGIAVSGNSLSDIGGYGIKMTKGKDHNITDNIINNVNINNGYLGGIHTWGAVSNVTVTGNEVTGARGVGIIIGGTDSALVENNLVRDSSGGGIQVAGGSSNIMVRNNTCQNNGEAGIQIVAPATNVTVADNHASGAEYGIKLGRRSIVGEYIDGIVFRDNDFDDNSAGWLLIAALVKNVEVYPPLPPDSTIDSFDWFPGALAASTDYVHAAIAGTGTGQIITAGITNPDVSRNISVTATDNAAPSGNVLIEGINAEGDTDSEEITIIAGGTAYGSKAFAVITGITIPAGLSAADTVEIGMSDKLGLSQPIYAASDVFEVKGYRVTPTVDVTNGTLDFAPIEAHPDPRFPNIRVWYRTPLPSD